MEGKKMVESHRGNGAIGRLGERYLKERFHSCYQVQGYEKSNLGTEVGIQVVESTHQQMQNIECIKT